MRHEPLVVVDTAFTLRGKACVSSLQAELLLLVRFPAELHKDSKPPLWFYATKSFLSAILGDLENPILTT